MRKAPFPTAILQHSAEDDEYWKNTYDHMRDMEKHTMGSTQSMDLQVEINWDMRPCLVDFLIEVHLSFCLRPETLYLALNVVDRYVSRRIVLVKYYQLVGCVALWIAAKFEEPKDHAPAVEDLVQACHGAYRKSSFIQMEFHILSTIQWMLGHPTAEAWLRLMSRRPRVDKAKVQHVARFLMEVTLFYREFIKYAPSSIALAALTLARFLCGEPTELGVWEETDTLPEVVNLLKTRLTKPMENLSETLVKKYSYTFYSNAAALVVQHYLQR